MNRLKIAVIFGGRSAEHEVSLQSAKNVIDALDRDKYLPVLIGIDKQGRWYLNQESKFLLNADNPKLIALNKSDREVTLKTEGASNRLVSLTDNKSLGKIDVVFPVLHGPYGEDGTMQGLLKLANVPFVGASVTGSAVGMDKDVMKRLVRDAGIPIGKFMVVHEHEKKDLDINVIKEKLGMPVFVKPANLGSSVGISKVSSPEELGAALERAFEFDSKVILEEFIKGREIECAVLGNENPAASVPGEILPTHEFYSYEAKYIDEKGAALEIPAKLSETVVKKVQELAVRTFKVLCCEGMARVDMFVTEKDEMFVNEINTIPGFTRISMYPKLWEASGIPYQELIDRLIQLALERFKREQRLKISMDTG
jgi:D-alanine-D-alanine ligase